MSDGDQYLLPVAPDLPHPLGRAGVNHKPENRLWAVRPFLPQMRSRKPGPWWARHNFDQRGSSCTMQTAIGMLLSSPFRKQRGFVSRVMKDFGTEEQRHAGYLTSQTYDPWAGGEPQYEGTSSDAPAQLLRELGFIREWRWNFGQADVVDCLEAKSPVGMGTIWHESMFQVDKRGYIIVDKNSPIVGGHEWLELDWDRTDDEGIALNSWGRPWGVNGRFRIKGPDQRYLLEANGDSWTAIL